MCDVIDGQQADMKFDSQTREAFSTLSCKANTDRESRSGNVDVTKSNANMPDYFRSSTNREVDERAS